MKRKLLACCIAATVLFFAGCQKDQTVETPQQDLTNELVSLQNGDLIPGSYIITFKESGSLKSGMTYKQRQTFARAEVESVLIKNSIALTAVKHTYSHMVTGFSAQLTSEEVERLRADDKVATIEQDQYVILKKGGGKPTPTPSQTTPYGITRVGGGAAYTGNNVAWILNTGIDLDHPDLNVDASRSVAFGQRDAEDGHGHGTHVAGTIAAIDNNYGVIGVAPGATVIAIRILDRRGYGATSDCIAGVDYVGANGAPGDVANMSVGYPASTALDQAVVNAAAQGIYFALAAGNDGLHTYNSPQPSPGRVNGTNIWTVSAMDINDDFAYFSNYGNPPVEYCAPGVSVLSCDKRGGYTTMSGTSMATPHVAGILLVTNGNPSTSGRVNNDPDNNADPIAHI